MSSSSNQAVSKEDRAVTSREVGRELKRSYNKWLGRGPRQQSGREPKDPPTRASKYCLVLDLEK